MIRRKPESRRQPPAGLSHDANRFAYVRMPGGARPERRIDTACRHLAEAAAQLEPLLDGPGGAEAHEAVGLIMEALQRLNEAQGRIAPGEHAVATTAAE